MESNTGKKDFFGRRSKKDKFPYYPYGTIIPKCESGARAGANKNRRPNTAKKKEVVCAPPQDNCGQSSITGSSSYNRPFQGRGIGTSIPAPPGRPGASSSGSSDHRSSSSNPSNQRRRSKDVNSLELCGRLAQIVAQELPNCDLDTSFLEDIQTKCRCYWDTLTKYNIHLDAEAVFNELAQKLRAWVRSNQHLIESHSYLHSHSHLMSASNLEESVSEMEEEEESYREVLRIPFDEPESEEESLEAEDNN